MTSYAPPLSLPPIFNPSLFSNETTAVVNSSAPPESTYVLYPEPQGAITFINSGNEVEIGALKLSILQDVAIVPNGVEMNATGIAYDSGSGPVQAVTWDNLAKKVAAVQALTQAPDATTLAVNNAISIQNGETDAAPAQKIVISADATGNRIAIDGAYGSVGSVLVSGGSAGSIAWGSSSGTVPTIEEVLTAGYDAGFLSITNLNNIQIADGGGAPTNVELACNGTSLSLSTASVVGTKQFSGTYLPIYVDGEQRYIQLFSDPPP